MGSLIRLPHKADWPKESPLDTIVIPSCHKEYGARLGAYKAQQVPVNLESLRTRASTCQGYRRSENGLENGHGRIDPLRVREH